MPVTQYACPPDKPTYGESHTALHCISECTHKCFSPLLMAAIISSNQRNHHKGRYVSATALDGCVRKLKLERTENYAEYFKNLFFAYRGTVMHAVVEDAAKVDLGGSTLESLGYISEWRMQIGFCFEHGGFHLPADIDASDMATWAQNECPGCKKAGLPARDQQWIVLGGTLDNMEALWDTLNPKTGEIDAVLYDLKSMKEYAIGYFIKGDAKNTLHPQVKDGYVKQARVYAYLASICDPPPELQQRGVKRVRMVSSHIQAFAMGEAPWTGGGTYRWKGHYTHPLKDWPMYPIELADRAWVEDYVRRRAYPIMEALLLDQTRGPVCEPEKSSKGSHSWLCDWCAFFGSPACPNPSLEYQLIVEGVPPESAFRTATKDPVELLEERVGELTDDDTKNVTEFYRKRERKALAAAGKAEPEEAPPTVEKKVRKPRAKKSAA